MTLKNVTFFLCLLAGHSQSTFVSEFSAELEATINTVLCAVQRLVKRREAEEQNNPAGTASADSDSIRKVSISFFGSEFLGHHLGRVALKASEAAREAEGEEEPVEDLLKPGHLTRLLEEELAADVEALCVQDVSGGVEQLLGRLRTHRDSCQPQQLQVAGRADDVLTSFIHSAELADCSFLKEKNIKHCIFDAA